MHAAYLVTLALALTLTSQPCAAQQPSEPASEMGAFATSLVGTLVPVAFGALLWTAAKDHVVWTGSVQPADLVGPAMVIAGGVVIGPALGYWTSGRAGRGWKTLGLRAALVLISFVPAPGICGWDCGPRDDAYKLAWLVVATGSGLAAASAAYDIARVKGEVRRDNARRGLSLEVTPAFAPATRAVGLRLRARF